MTSEPLPAAAQAEHLTAALRRAGVLGAGSVRAVAVEASFPTILSRIIRLRLDYDGDAADAPRALLLKTGHPDRIGPDWQGGRQEVAFYTQVAPATPPGLLPRCFEAAHDAATHAWHLLLEDLTATHAVPTAWPLPPGAAQCAAIIEARARFHAAWWDDARLGVSIGAWADAAAVAGYLERLAAVYARFVDRVGDLLPPERRRLYERLLDTAPRLMRRHDGHRHMTIMHGDAHVWNCLLARDGGGDVRLFDWDSWRLDTASDDLAYMMAMHWYPDHRARLEAALLDRYHAALLAHGVTGYDRRALADDYRLSALWQITIPLWQAANNIPPVIWWNNLERSLLAVDDLGCRELLDG